MKLQFAKHENEIGRSLDVNLFADSEEQVEKLAELLENEVDCINFVYETIEELEDGKFNIIGTIEYEYGYMAEKKTEAKEAFKKVKKLI
jgi:cell division protein ZapA (FtsZ GTPase activity inhibitor)